MDLVEQSKVLQFAELAIKAGWEWCGVQEAISPCPPVLVIRRHGRVRSIPFDPENFEPLKLASEQLAPQEKKMTDKLNLRQKMIQIYNELDHVGKWGENTKQHYNFVRAADVMRPVRAAFAKWGVYAETNYELLGTYDIKTNNGGNMHTATVKATIILHDIDSDETLTISGLGDGADSGDKGIFKAQTGATKNALRNGTLLPDEADPEADESVDENTEVTKEPDFRDTQRPTPAPAATGAATTSAATTSTPKRSNTSTAAPADAPSTPEPESAGVVDSDSPEHGDAYEGPDDDGVLPTEEELQGFREKFKKLSDALATKEGGLKASPKLPGNVKLRVFMLHITGAEAAPSMTKTQWENFFQRADAAVANPAVGLKGLTKLVNKANGIETKEE
jgi:hypothetical protein